MRNSLQICYFCDYTKPPIFPDAKLAQIVIILSYLNRKSPVMDFAFHTLSCLLLRICCFALFFFPVCVIKLLTAYILHKNKYIKKNYNNKLVHNTNLYFKAFQSVLYLCVYKKLRTSIHNVQ